MKHNEMKKVKRFRIGRLETASDVRKFLARMVKSAVRAGGGSQTNDAYKVSLMAAQLLKAIEVSELERRINELERKIQ